MKSPSRHKLKADGKIKTYINDSGFGISKNKHVKKQIKRKEDGIGYKKISSHDRK